MTFTPEIPNSKADDPTSMRSRWGHIAKLALASYLNSCIDGTYKSLFSKFATYSKYWKIRTDQHFSTDPKYPQSSNENPLSTPILIARYFQESQEQPPQIFIRVTSWNRVSRNLGGISKSFKADNGSQILSATDDIVVDVDITAATAGSEDDLSRLIDFLDLAFGPVGQLLHKGILISAQEENRTWSVGIPLVYTVGSINEIPIGEDKKSRIWTQNLTLAMLVETTIFMTYDLTGTALPVLSMETSVDLPTNFRVGQKTKIGVTNRPANSIFIIDDFKKAVVFAETDQILAKRPGTITLCLIDASKGRDGGQIFYTESITILP